MLSLPEVAKQQLLLQEWVDLILCTLYQLETKVQKQHQDLLMQLVMDLFWEKEPPF